MSGGSALQRAEVVFFMKPEEEAATRAFLSRFKTEPVTQAIVDGAAASTAAGKG